MAKAKNKKASDPHSTEGKTKVVALCGRCDGVSGAFYVPEEDLDGDKFVPKMNAHYGCCSCGAYWVDGRALRDPDAAESRVIILQRETNQLRAQLTKQKTQIEAYEKAMSLMGGGPGMRMGRTFFGMPY